MSTVQIGGSDYPTYADVAFADQYLAGDMLRAPVWAAQDPTLQKPVALVSATRLLQAQTWKAGSPPDTEDPELPVEVQQACALLAADIAAKPAKVDGTSTGSNVKAVGAGSARVEFFAPVLGKPLPSAAFALIADLLGPPGDLDASGVADNAAYGSSNCQRSRFDRTDYGLYGDGRSWVDPDELFF